MTKTDVNDSTLGQKVNYSNEYDPTLLFKIDRQTKRSEIGINSEKLPFKGVDIWTAYEVSWLNLNGVPKVVIAEISIPAHSLFIVESKSLKLYLNSFNQTKYASSEDVKTAIRGDLEKLLETKITIKFVNLSSSFTHSNTDYEIIDSIDCSISEYSPNKNLLKIKENKGDFKVCSHLLKSNCLVTNQPDWGSVFIEYSGNEINEESLLRYIISFRNHNEFHEQCVERIFSDIMISCRPERLSVYARYTRRGGIDINPYRSTETKVPITIRVNRQ